MPNNVIVPEIGTKCIYPVLDAEKIKNFCIQYDGKIIDTTGQKVLQTKGNTYYLEHSTDTTAIKSFDNATIIGVVFALCATWFAWWCAKKSFEITKLSFDSLIQEIKETAENTKVSNLELIRSQENIKRQEINAERVLYLITNIREYFALFTAESSYIGNESYSLFNHIKSEYALNVNYDPNVDILVQKKIMELTAKRVSCEQTKSRIELLLDHQKNSHIQLLSKTDSCFQDMLNCFIGAINQNNSSSIYTDFQAKIKSLTREASQVVKNEIGE